jgi:4-amino-4-deoxy-L-arabinose transferase-like glycosyltransferase
VIAGLPARSPTSDSSVAAPPDQAAAPTEGGRVRRAWAVALLGVLALALALRVPGVAWQLPWQFHPDEGHYVVKATGMVRDGNLNPKYFRNPSLYTYILLVQFKVLDLAGLPSVESASVSELLGTPTLYTLQGRLTSALLGVATVLIVYLLGARLVGRAVGLLGALFLAVAFIHVRDSHFATNDVTATFFLTVSVLFSARLAQTGRTRELLGAALFGGLATSAKYNAGLFIAPLLVGYLLAYGRGSLALRPVGKLVGSGVLSALAYLAGTPFTLLAWPTFIDDFRTQRGFSREGWEGQGPEPVWQLYLDAFSQGLGWVMFGLALLGLLLMARRRPGAAALLAAYPLVYIGYMLGVKLFFVRFAVMAVPFLCLLAGYAVWQLASRASRPSRRLFLVGALTVAAIAQPLWNDFLFGRILTERDTRRLAYEWLNDYAGPDARVVAEQYSLRDRRPREFLPDRSRFDLDVVNALGEHPLEHYRERRYGYAVTSTFQAGRFPGNLNTYPDLEARARLLAMFTPARDGGELPFDIEDLYGPFHDLSRYERPGPTVKIYALDPP